MFIDIIFPKKNEKQFIKLAEKLNYSSLCFVYNFAPDIISKTQLLKELQKTTKINLFLGLQSAQANIQKAKNLSNLVLVKSVPEQDQRVLEKLSPDIIFDLELFPKKDPLNFRLSGLNQVLCNLAHKNKVAVAFSFSSILNSKNKPQLLGRIMQNITLCRKYKVKTIFASFAQNPLQMRSAHDLISLATVLGMHPSEAKSSLTNALNTIQQNQKNKSPDYISEDIEVIS
ncbi:hypothetical protein KY331_01870 [Candidatus Woesearchaeota archaeon]|nr:hypothetical protein [Candidatus Woesearchaeota archaeon]